MRIESSGLTREVTCASAFLEDARSGEHHAPPAKILDDNLSASSSSSTSSIGKNSDLSSEGDEDSGQNEAQSAFNGPFDMMHSLEEVLPFSKGISKFYNGKSKSFTSLADASVSPSIKDVAKPQNAYTRKRKALMAFNHAWNKNHRSSLPLIRGNNGGISKRPTLNSSRSTLGVAVALKKCDSSTSSCSSSSEDSNNVKFPLLSLPPLHPQMNVYTISTDPSYSSTLHQNFSPWRSFSLVDLQHCATAATMKISTSPSIRNETPNLICHNSNN